MQIKKTSTRANKIDSLRDFPIDSSVVLKVVGKSDSSFGDVENAREIVFLRQRGNYFPVELEDSLHFPRVDTHPFFQVT